MNQRKNGLKKINSDLLHIIPFFRANYSTKFHTYTLLVMANLWIFKLELTGNDTTKIEEERALLLLLALL